MENEMDLFIQITDGYKMTPDVIHASYGSNEIIYKMQHFFFYAECLITGDEEEIIFSTNLN